MRPHPTRDQCRSGCGGVCQWHAPANTTQHSRSSRSAAHAQICEAAAPRDGRLLLLRTQPAAAHGDARGVHFREPTQQLLHLRGAAQEVTVGAGAARDGDVEAVARADVAEVGVGADVDGHGALDPHLVGQWVSQ
eukprot:scaffold10953_cov60-Phaeocystis_antarctica.AAC.4